MHPIFFHASNAVHALLGIMVTPKAGQTRR